MSDKTKSDRARANGKRSNGPVTAEGKARSAQNSKKHGQYATPVAVAHVAVLRNEDCAAFNNLLARLNQDLLPTNSSECSLVRELCAIEWRLIRNMALRTRAIDIQIAAEGAAIRRTQGSLRGVEPIDLTVMAVAKLLETSKLLTYSDRELARLHRARRDILNTLFSLRKRPQGVVRSQEPAMFQELDRSIEAGYQTRNEPTELDPWEPQPSPEDPQPQADETQHTPQPEQPSPETAEVKPNLAEDPGSPARFPVTLLAKTPQSSPAAHPDHSTGDSNEGPTRLEGRPAA
ncbi:hypothetical protein [Paludibaculum fermentans]|uniref:hypothetical protein n=1 Tax=Paludibaculum fermentans TaxID=1473598 RepID=UPI003EB92FBE